MSDQEKLNPYTQQKIKKNSNQTPGYKEVPRKAVPSTTIVSNEEFVRYEFDFSTGAQTQIFFGDIWVDDINFIEFHVAHPKIPIYGYASKLYNTTTPGRILVTGSFRINFKESYYLHLLFTHLGQNGMIPGMQDRLKKQQYQYNQAGRNGEQVKQALDSDVLWHNTIETTMAALNRPEGPRNMNYTGESGLAATLGTTNPAIFREDEKAFESQAEALEDKIWGPPAGTSSETQRVDEFGPFDIYLVYGDLNNQFANHTVRRLYGVELASTTQQIQIDGLPVQEAYTFIARDFR